VTTALLVEQAEDRFTHDRRGNRAHRLIDLLALRLAAARSGGCYHRPIDDRKRCQPDHDQPRDQDRGPQPPPAYLVHKDHAFRETYRARQRANCLRNPGEAGLLRARHLADEAGEPGFEPGFTVLETALIAVRSLPRGALQLTWWTLEKPDVPGPPSEPIGPRFVMRAEGVEPTRSFEHQDLNLACLPVPARPLEPEDDTRPTVARDRLTSYAWP
jgi:hypothetical protein